jgi:hypothetical protein
MTERVTERQARTRYGLVIEPAAGGRVRWAVAPEAAGRVEVIDATYGFPGYALTALQESIDVGFARRIDTTVRPWR